MSEARETENLVFEVTDRVRLTQDCVATETRMCLDLSYEPCHEKTSFPGFR